MKTTKIAILILAIAVLLYILIPSLSWAENGTAPVQRETFPSMVARFPTTLQAAL